jgi:hypothetical protein
VGAGGRGDTGGVAMGVGTLGGDGAWVVSGLTAVENMSDSCLMAVICSSPIADNGDAGAGLRIAKHRAIAARIAASADDNCGIFPK